VSADGRPVGFAVGSAVATACALVTTTLFIGRKNFWLDESYSFVAAHRSLSDIVRLVGHDRENGGAMGVYYLVLHFWLHVGRSESVVRLLSVPLAVATVPLVGVVARRLYGARAGVIAAALTAANVMVVQYAQEARAYSMLLFAAALSMWLFVDCVLRPRTLTAAGWMVTCAVGFYAHYYIALLVVAEMATLLALPRARRPRMLLIASAGFAVAVAPLLVALATMEAAGPLPSAYRASLSDPARLLYHFSGSIPLALIEAGLLAFAAVQVYRTLRSRTDDRWLAIFPWVLLVVPPLLMLAVSVFHPAWRERYLIICLPAFLLLVSHALDEIPRALVRNVALAVVGGLSLLALGLYYAPSVKGAADWRAAAAFVSPQSARGGALLFLPPTGYVPVAYYDWARHVSAPVVLQLTSEPLRDSIHPRTVPTATVRARAASQSRVCVLLLAPTKSAAARWTRLQNRTISVVLGGRFTTAARRTFGPLLTVQCFTRRQT
jgi:mannosyltransferase